MHKWIDVAALTGKRNLKGRFVARSAPDLSFMPEEGMEVAFVPPRLDCPRCARVACVRSLDERTYEISFEGVEGPEATERLVGAHCLVERSLVGEDCFVRPQGVWEGFAVIDREAGCLGVMGDVIDNPGQSLLSVERADGQGELLIPLVDEFIVSIDEEARAISVALPAGLLDL